MPPTPVWLMPLCHAAPEVLTSARYDAKLADIWSAGVMLYTMLCCSYPFEKQEDDPKDLRTQTKIMQRIMKGDFPLPEQGVMGPAPLLGMSVSNLMKTMQSQIILHSSFKACTPDTDIHHFKEKDSNACILCVSSSAVPAYALYTEGLDVGYVAAVQVMSVMLLSHCWPIANVALNLPCSGVRVACIAPDQQGVQGPRQQGAGGRSQEANGNTGHPGGLLPQLE